MSAKHQVVSEKEILNEAVSLDRPRKVRTQDAPRVWPLLPWLDLLNSYVAHPQKEGCREIGIERLAVEISEMKRVPGCMHLVTCEGISGRASLRYQRAIELFDGDSIRRQHRALIHSPERSHRRAFLVQPRREPTRTRVRQKTLKAKKPSTGNDRCFDFRVAAPTIIATVSIEDFGEQLVHKGPPSRRRCITGGRTEGIWTDDMTHAPWVVLWA